MSLLSKGTFYNNIQNQFYHQKISGLLNFISPYHRTIYPVFGNQLRNAARKGTRERKQKKKVKVEEKKVGFIPKNIRDREK